MEVLPNYKVYLTVLMNKLKPVFLSLALLLASLTAKAQTQNNNQQTVSIKTSAVCGMCKRTIEKAVAGQNGVSSTSLNVDSKILTVVFDTRKTDTDKLRKVVTEVGYDADSLHAQQKAYNNLNACCKKGAH